MKETVKPAPGDRGGVGELFATVTVRLATAVRLRASVTVAVSARVPLAAVVVFQLKLGFVPAYSWASSTVTLKL